MSGLRERNRLRTRQEIADAALLLYSEVGFDAATVDDIAAAAGVSRSTFFRYFPSKEHAVFPTHDDDIASYRAHLDAASPHDHHPHQAILTAAHDAAHATIDAYRRDPGAYRRRHHVIESNPSVHALGLKLNQDWEDVLAEAFEPHLTAVTPDAALQARLLAGGLLGIVNAFHRQWAAVGFPDDPAGYRQHVMAVFEHGLHATTRT
jgi:AcrR family transcriptional regulator